MVRPNLPPSKSGAGGPPPSMLSFVAVGTLCFLLGTAWSNSGGSMTMETAESTLLSLLSQEIEASSSGGLQRNPVSSTAGAQPLSSSTSSMTPDWFQKLARDGETTCPQISNKVQTKEWQDPNHQQVYLRQVVTSPPFFVSVHNSEYDPLRFRTIFQKGNYYEHLNRQRFEYILSRNKDASKPFVLDVGGNIGYYTLLSAAWKHHVVTFEINPANLLRICESLRYNEFLGQVKLHRKGVSDTSGQQLQIEVPTNPGAVGLIGASDVAAAEGGKSQQTTAKTFSVSTITLDDFAQQHGWFDQHAKLLENFSIWKLDVEGLEATILQGSKSLIASKLAQNVLVEYRPKSAREAVNLLIEAGYVIVDDESNNKQKRLLTKTESHAFLDAIYKSAEERNNWKYSDLWFRRADVALT